MSFDFILFLLKMYRFCILLFCFLVVLILVIRFIDLIFINIEYSVRLLGYGDYLFPGDL